MATIYLFRHGQTENNLNKVFTGWSDSALTPTGVAQAHELGVQLKDKKIDVAIQTRLTRSRDTLKEVLVFHPECTRILTDDRMIERSYGELVGRTHKSVIDELGAAQFDAWHRGYAVRPPGGESFADVEKRVAPFIADLKYRFGGTDSGIAVSAHGNSIRVFRKLMEHADEADAVSWTIPYDRFFEYSI